MRSVYPLGGRTERPAALGAPIGRTSHPAASVFASTSGEHFSMTKNDSVSRAVLKPETSLRRPTLRDPQSTTTFRALTHSTQLQTALRG